MSFFRDSVSSRRLRRSIVCSQNAWDIPDRSKTWWAVEVKSHRSGADDLTRGLFQCVKYEAVLRARGAVDDSPHDVSATLVVGRDLPSDVNRGRQLLGIQVVSNLDISGRDA
jgi:hypothetical protein